VVGAKRELLPTGCWRLLILAQAESASKHPPGSREQGGQRSGSAAATGGNTALKGRGGSGATRATGFAGKATTLGAGPGRSAGGAADVHANFKYKCANYSCAGRECFEASSRLA
jgi:hypothetical protein